ncbi:MAG TPA: argininosuccinate synthase [Gammaproteobacteria bacterium]|nr:argininosuccinate synthase [Gammaproteobacteria bacterium]
MTPSSPAGESPILLAFSGGLDTSFCVSWLKETLGRPVITVTVDTGGEIDAAALETRALALGAERHITVDARAEFFSAVLKYLVFGNVRRGQLYPLCVGAERGLQARLVAEQAALLGSDTVAHGSTAAGNDQVRFEIALRTLRPELEVLAPVRDHDWQRADQVAWLEARGLPAPPGGGAYSINRGLWGTTIGGKETLDSLESIPESAWVVTAGAFDTPRAPERHRVGFGRGVPVSLDGDPMDPVSLIERLETLAGPFGIGRGIHLGETILGSKGRVAFEAPAAETLLTAHRELEKLTLTGTQQKIKEPLALAYGDLVHEGQHLEPAARDIEALLASSQARVTGEVRLLFRPGVLFVEGVSSPHSLLAATRGQYGESAGEWSAADALGLARMRALAGMLHTRAGG